MKENKTALAKQIVMVEKHLKEKRIKCFLGITVFYSVISFGVLCIIDGRPATLLEFIGFLFASIFLGILFWLINAAIWTNCVQSINDTLNYKKRLEKEYSEILSDENRRHE